MRLCSGLKAEPLKYDAYLLYFIDIYIYSKIYFDLSLSYSNGRSGKLTGDLLEESQRGNAVSTSDIGEAVVKALA